MSSFLAYHMSYTASFLTIGAITYGVIVPLYIWTAFASTRKGRR